MVFCGCSFTHGHGLWQYFDFKDNPSDDSCHSLRSPHVISKDSIRFPRLVANHFKTFEVVRDLFSGDDENTIGYINQLFSINDGYDYPFITYGNEPPLYFDFEDISHVIIQTSYPDRCQYILDTDTKERFQLGEIDDDNKPEKIKEWGFDTFEDYYDELVSRYFNELRHKILQLKSKGIKVYILSITDDYYQKIINDVDLKDLFIHIEHDGEKFSCFNDLFSHDPSLRIKGDFETFGFNVPIDFHPSKKCHEIVSKSIIKKIEKNG